MATDVDGAGAVGDELKLSKNNINDHNVLMFNVLVFYFLMF